MARREDLACLAAQWLTPAKDPAELVTGACPLGQWLFHVLGRQSRRHFAEDKSASNKREELKLEAAALAPRRPAAAPGSSPRVALEHARPIGGLELSWHRHDAQAEIAHQQATRPRPTVPNSQAALADIVKGARLDAPLPLAYARTCLDPTTRRRPFRQLGKPTPSGAPCP